MSIEITSENKNPLLGRKEVEFQLVSKITPTRSGLKAELAKALKAKEELIVIDIVDQKTGSNLTTGKAKVYEKEDVMAKVDLAYRSKRGVKEQKEAPAPAPAEAPADKTKEEAPVEAVEEPTEGKPEAEKEKSQ